MTATEISTGSAGTLDVASMLAEKRRQAVRLLEDDASYSSVSEKLGLPTGMVADWGREAIANGGLKPRRRFALQSAVAEAPVADLIPVDSIEPEVVVDAVEEEDVVPARVGVMRDEHDGPFLSSWILAAGGNAEGIELILMCLRLLVRGRSYSEIADIVQISEKLVQGIGETATDRGVLSEEPRKFVEPT